MPDTTSSESKAHLVIQAMCCVIAADGRVNGPEIDVVFDALTSIGLRQSKTCFRDKVIEACKDIHRRGAIAVADGLLASLAELRGGSLAATVLQLQEDVMRADGRVTDSEKAVVAKFHAALSPWTDSAHETTQRPTINAAHGEAAIPYALEDERLPLTYTPLERLLGLIIHFRRAVDVVLGFRLLLAMFVSVTCGTIAVFAYGALASSVRPAAEGFAIAAALLWLGADDTLRRLSEDPSRRRAMEARLLGQAFEIASALECPPASNTDTVAVTEPTDLDEVTADTDGEILGFDAASRLLGDRTWSIPYRAKVARRLFELLRGSRQRGEGRLPCRCTNCGRKYWFRFGEHGTGVLCPYCGCFQHATQDWVVAAPLPPVAVRPFARLFASDATAYCGGPVTVRGYVNKHGTWVASHTRSRPRRRRW